MNAFKLFFSRHRIWPHIHTHLLTGLDYSYIADGIYVGTNQCCTEGLMDVLKKEGITHDISMDDRRLDSPFGAASCTWLPTHEGEAPAMPQLEVGVSILRHLLRRGEKVYVHSRFGYGRVSVLVAAYFIRTRQMTPEAAIEFIHSKRPGAHLEPAQMAALKEFAAETHVEHGATK